MKRAHEAAPHLLDEVQPGTTIDNDANLARFASLKYPELAVNLIGVTEETINGVRAFQQIREVGALIYLVVAVNDNMLKIGFDGAHNAGETCMTTMQRILGKHTLDSENVTIIGYGPAGQDFAWRIRVLSAEATICNIDPVVSLKAAFDDFAA